MRLENLGVVLLLVGGALACDPPARANRPVLLLKGSAGGDAPSQEAQVASELGLDVHAVTPAQWSAMSTDQFRGYRALIIGDDACQLGTDSLQALKRTRGVWEAAVDGHVVVAGEEPYPNSREPSLAEEILRASESPSRTGRYLALKCAHALEPLTPSLPLGGSNELPLCSTQYPIPGQGPGVHCKQACEVQATTLCGATVSIDNGSTMPGGGTLVCTQEPSTTDLLEIDKTTDVLLTCRNAQGEFFDYCATYVTVTDHTLPFITLNAPVAPIVECGSAYVDPGATANDPCEGKLTDRIVTTGSVNTAVPKPYTITYDVQDSKRQSAPSVTRTVEVRDTVAPTLNCPQSIEVEAERDGWATVTPSQTWATDTCSAITGFESSAPRLTVGTMTVTYTAKDAAGNQASCSVLVTVLSPPDRAMVGGGCNAASWGTAAPVVWVALMLLWRRRMPQGTRRFGRVKLSGWGGIVILGALAISGPTSAQPTDIPAFELERLRLNPSGMGSWVLGTGELLPAGGYRLALAGHYENKPLILYEEGVLLGVIVRHRATAVLSGAVGLGGRVELGAQAPLVLSQQGDDLTDRGVGTPQGGVAPGTPLLTVRLSLLAEQRKDSVDLSAGLSASPGLGSASALARELHAIPNLMLGRRFGAVRASLDAGFMLRPRIVLNNDNNIQDELGHALRLSAGLSTTAEGLGGEVAAIGSVPTQREGYSLELLGGVRLPVGELLEVQGLTGLGLGNAPGTPRFRLLLGMSFGKVARPQEPSLEAQASHEVDDPDRDRDGVLNRVDACPDEPGPASRRGCPVLDSDGDGVVDEKDQCPNRAGIVEMAGCPLKDTDGDTVWDHLDNCREIPGPSENQGCPAKDRQLVVIQRRRIAIKDTIHFDYDKATIKSVSFPLLNQVAQVLIEHPEIVSVSIEGHTDDIGTATYNRDLALRRAGAVRDYLESQGVARSRMTVQSFGEDRPLQSNATEQGRATNRRVEFITRYEADAS